MAKLATSSVGAPDARAGSNYFHYVQDPGDLADTRRHRLVPAGQRWTATMASRDSRTVGPDGRRFSHQYERTRQGITPASAPPCMKASYVRRELRTHGDIAVTASTIRLNTLAHARRRSLHDHLPLPLRTRR